MKNTIKNLLKIFNEFELANKLGVSVATIKQYKRGMQPNEENKTKIKNLCILHSVEVSDEV